MKKTRFYLSTVFLLSFLFVNQGCAVTQEQKLKKEEKKQYSKKMKRLENEGWKIEGSKTMEVALLSHYVELGKSDDNKELVGYVSICKSMNVCKQNALNNAIMEYASAAGSYVKGRVTSDLQNDQTIEEGEFDKMYAAYERLVEKEIRGELVKSFSIVKDNGTSKSYQAFYIINEESASKARIKALQQAVKETEVAQEYARKISEFVKEGFEIK